MIDFITQIDFSILNFIQNMLRCDFLDAVMKFFSYIGEGGIIWLAISVPMLFFRKSRSWGIMMIVSMLIAFITGELIIKNVVCRYRPFIDLNISNLPVLHASGFSFPSSHSSTGFAAATVLFRMNKKYGTAAIVLACIISFSRLYNYVHFPSDVLAGILLGIGSALLVCFAFKKFGWQNKISRLGSGGN